MHIATYQYYVMYVHIGNMARYVLTLVYSVHAYACLMKAKARQQM